MYTKGEWLIDPWNPELVAIEKEGIFQYICDCATELHDGCITQEQEQANAILISNSPKLLKELIDAVYRMEEILIDSQLDSRFPDGKTIRKKFEDYNKVIKKAKGD